MSKGGGGSSSSSGSQETVPWIHQQPFLHAGYQEAWKQYQQPIEYYPGQTLASRDPITARALEAMGQRVNAPGSAAAEQQVSQTAGGAYLNQNPFIDAMYNQAAQRLGENYQRTTMPGVVGRYGAAGRFGRREDTSGALERGVRSSQDVLGDQLQDLAVNLYGGNYQAERGRQLQAAQIAPQVAAGRAGDLRTGLQGGLGREEYGQREIEDARTRFEFGQYEPWERMQMYNELIGSPVMQSRGSQRAKSWNANYDLGGGGVGALLGK